MARRSDVVLEEILDEIETVEQALAGHTPASFAKARFVQRGAERSLEITSDAVRRLPEAILAMRPEISWVDIRSIGNNIRHEYWRFDPALIWQIVRNDLPPLRAAFEYPLLGLDA